jgi:hypothetical protein
VASHETDDGLGKVDVEVVTDDVRRKIRRVGPVLRVGMCSELCKVERIVDFGEG